MRAWIINKDGKKGKINSFPSSGEKNKIFGFENQFNISPLNIKLHYFLLPLELNLYLKTFISYFF
jgi:hypothetical protein